MKDYAPYLVIAVLLVAMVAFSVRNRRKLAENQAAIESRIGFGTEVMTTSGLYGTVVSRNADDTVQLSIAPGVEVRWAIAALRDVQSLPDRYRGPIDHPEDGPGPGATGS